MKQEPGIFSESLYTSKLPPMFFENDADGASEGGLSVGSPLSKVICP